MANETKSGWMGIALSVLGGMVLGAIGAGLAIRFLPGIWARLTGAQQAAA